MPQPHYNRFSYEERIILENRLRNGEKPSEIAAALERPRCTIYREIKRNSTPSSNNTSRINKPAVATLDARHYRGSVKSYEIREAKFNYSERIKQFKLQSTKYTAQHAEQEASKRRTSPPRLLDKPEYEDTLQYIESKLKERWSPEQISGRIKTENILPMVSHVTIYAYIYQIKDVKIRESLICCLRRKGRPYRHIKHTTYNQTDRTRHSIHDRPPEVETLTRLGDLEGDTIVGKNQKDRIVTHVCRVTGLLSMSRVLNFNANSISNQTIQDVTRVFGDIKTITYDNGSEFSAWRNTERATDSTIYFADPYTPSQRGCNENTNGLIRDYLPKGTDFRELNESDIIRIENSLNNRPRKRLGYLTPLEMYELVR